jgi:hypothetical protein
MYGIGAEEEEYEEGEQEEEGYEGEEGREEEEEGGEGLVMYEEYNVTFGGPEMEEEEEGEEEEEYRGSGRQRQQPRYGEGGRGGRAKVGPRGGLQRQQQKARVKQPQQGPWPLVNLYELEYVSCEFFLILIVHIINLYPPPHLIILTIQPLHIPTLDSTKF